METRDIIIANTRTQKKYMVTTNASTLGELKAALDNYSSLKVRRNNEWVANNDPIDYDGLEFTEGFSHLKFMDDESPLPETVMHKGQPTKTLVMILTNTRKKINLGMTRKEIYEIIRNHDLQDAIKEHFGRNYTVVSTDSLEQFTDVLLANIAETSKQTHSFEDDVDEDADEEESCNTDEPCFGSDFDIDSKEIERRIASGRRESYKNSILTIAESGLHYGLLNADDISDIQVCLEMLLKSNTESSDKKYNVGNIEISDKEIDDMLDNI